MATRAQKYLEGLIARGFSPVQAAVLAGNIAQESGFNPTAYNPKEDAYGLIQWRLDRKKGLEDFARATGRDPSDPDAQMDYLTVEMNGPEARNARDFLSAADAKTANAALKKYIRYGDQSEGARLKNALGYASELGIGEPDSGDTSGMQQVAQNSTGFVNPAFPNGMQFAAPSWPQAQSSNGQPETQAGSQPSVSDDDFLKSVLMGGPSNQAPSAQNAGADDDAFLKSVLMPDGSPASGDEDFLAQYAKATGKPVEAVQQSIEPQSVATPDWTPAGLGTQPVGTPANGGGGWGDEWKRGVLLPVETNTMTGEKRFAVPEIINSLIGGATLPGDIVTGKAQFDPRLSLADQSPEALDRAAALSSLGLSGGGMLELGMKPAAISNMLMGNGAKVPKLIAQELEREGFAPAKVSAAIQDIGPNAILADLTPTLQGYAGALAREAGPAKNMLVEGMTTRQKLANARIQAALQDLIGPPVTPGAVAEEIGTNLGQAGSLYPKVFAEKAKSGNPFVNLEAVQAVADDAIGNAVGGTQRKLKAARNMLLQPGGDLITSPPLARAVREELDGMIKAETNPNTARKLGDIRRSLDAELADQVPGLKAADAQYHELKKQEEAFAEGQKTLRGGETAKSPEELAQAMQEGAVPSGMFIGPSGVPFRIQQGLISDIARIVGTKANDRVALKEILKGEGSWNREKLETAFGKDKADALVKLFENEAKMAETEKMAIGNSVTETIRGAKEALAGKKTDTGVIRNALNLEFGDAAAALANKLMGRAENAVRMNRNEQLANALLSKGNWRVPMKPAEQVGAGAPLRTLLQNYLLQEAINGGALPPAIRNMLVAPATPGNQKQIIGKLEA